MQDTRLPSIVNSEEQLIRRADSDVPVDHERLKYVTRILGSQQGLYTVVFGIFYLLMELGGAWKGLLGFLALSAVLAGLWIFLAAYRRWIPRYYQKRFGHVEPRQPSNIQTVIFVGVIVVLAFFGTFLAHRIDPMISGLVNHLHLMISDPAHQINLWPSVFWAALFVSSLRWKLRKMEWRKLCFLLFGMLVFTSLVLLAMWHPDIRQAGPWRVLNVGGVGMSFIAMGLYDHIELVRLLPRRVSEGDDE